MKLFLSPTEADMLISILEPLSYDTQVDKVLHRIEQCRVLQKPFGVHPEGDCPPDEAGR